MKGSKKIIFALLGIFMGGGMAAWFQLMFTICDSPLMPSEVTQNTVRYNCHGTTVYITPLEDVLLHWLIPLLAIGALCLKLLQKRE